MRADPVVVVGGARTPIGRFCGLFKDVDTPDLAATVIVAPLGPSPVAGGRPRPRPSSAEPLGPSARFAGRVVQMTASGGSFRDHAGRAAPSNSDATRARGTTET